MYKTLIRLTRFERTKIIGQRATQIAHGATPLIQVPEGVCDANEIAQAEFEQGALKGLIIRRKLPNGSYWDVALKGN